MFVTDETIKKEDRMKLEKKLYAPNASSRDTRDLERIFDYRTNIQKYDHDSECMQFLPNFVQVNRRDIRLPDTDLVNIDSELKGITRNLSKVPHSRYLGPNTCKGKYNDKGICVCSYCLKKNVVNQNKKECSKKIINNHHIPKYSDCNNRRTETSNSDCKNNVYRGKTMYDTIMSYFY